MANEEQLAILKQGVKVWNKWREANPYVEIDLEEADLSGTNINGANLKDAYLVAANLNRALLSDANLREANLSYVSLTSAHLRGSDLRGADLSWSDLVGAVFIRANLSKAIFHEANLRIADLEGANLIGADLGWADLNGANLREANIIGSNFGRAEVGNTVFGKSDLSEALRLEDVVHRGPSSISTDTFSRSKGKISEVFLRGCGLSDWEIELVKLYNPDLSNEEINNIQYKMYDLRASQALQISPLFISYSHDDSSFVDKLEVYLKRKGVRFWRDVHKATSGPLEKQIDLAIRHNPTVLLILSSNSIRSDWVEHEVRTARDLAREMGRNVLCPMALDNSWKSSPWPQRLMEQVKEYNILDFSAWEDDRKFDDMFRRLIDGLDLFYK
jgi:uncharacterized protein YjbI with pentapeptide repeats